MAGGLVDGVFFGDYRKEEGHLTPATASRIGSLRGQRLNEEEEGADKRPPFKGCGLFVPRGRPLLDNFAFSL